MKLSENIKKLRKEKNMRQEQLAEAMGVSTAAVSKWETGQCAPELTVLMELADFFEVSVDTLMGHHITSDRIHALIEQAECAVSERREEQAANLCEKLLRNYPNDVQVVKSCADSYYCLFVYTEKKAYMEQCIAQTKRLMCFKRGEPERERLERLHSLGNQYALLKQWDRAKEYFEQSDVSGSSKASIAECLLKQEKIRESLVMLSDVLTTGIFQAYRAINTLVDGWCALGENERACSALIWVYDVMESVYYNPTIMMLIQIKLAGIYQDCKQQEAALTAVRKAAAQIKGDRRDVLWPKADFLLIEQKPELLLSSENDRDMLLNIAREWGPLYLDAVEEILS